MTQDDDFGRIKDGIEDETFVSVNWIPVATGMTGRGFGKADVNAESY